MIASLGSICHVNGYVLVYPKVADVTFHHADDAVKVRWKIGLSKISLEALIVVSGIPLCVQGSAALLLHQLWYQCVREGRDTGQATHYGCQRMSPNYSTEFCSGNWPNITHRSELYLAWTWRRLRSMSMTEKVKPKPRMKLWTESRAWFSIWISTECTMIQKKWNSFS